MGTVHKFLDALAFSEKTGLDGDDFLDFTNLLYCGQKQMPFSVSPARESALNKIAGATVDFGRSINACQICDRKTKDLAIAKWLFEIKCPRLELRSIPLRNSALENLQRNAPISWEAYKTIRTAIFISPEQLVDLLTDKCLSSLKSKIRAFAENVADRLDFFDRVTTYESRLNERLNKADILFGCVSLAFSWVPFSSAFIVPIQLGINQFIRRSFNWLFFISELNENKKPMRDRKNPYANNRLHRIADRPGFR